MTVEQVIRSTALPQPPSPNPFTPAQWHVLLAIADTVIAPVEPTAIPSASDGDAYTRAKLQLQSYADDTIVSAYLSERASRIPAFQDALLRFLGSHTAPDVRKGLASILSLLEYVDNPL